MSAAYLQCIDEGCRKRYPLDSKEHVCAACKNLLDVAYEFPRTDPATLKQTWTQRKSGTRGGGPERRMALP